MYATDAPVFVALGLAFLCGGRLLWNSSRHLFVYFLAERLGRTTDFPELGRWAVITGATDGIGKALAMELARRGCDIVLISRTEEKLTRVAKEIGGSRIVYPKRWMWKHWDGDHGDTYYVKTRIVVADFVKDDIYTNISQQLKGLEIGVLVNNVGMYMEYAELLHLAPRGEKQFVDTINCNMVSATMMTRIVLPQMLARKKGVIIGISSGAGLFPMAMSAVYSATKAYCNFFALAMNAEYKDKGVIFQSVLPWDVSTNMGNNAKPNLFVLDARDYARNCLNSVGYFGKTNGHPAHSLQNWIMSLLPESRSYSLAKYFMGSAYDTIMEIHKTRPDGPPEKGF